MTAGVRAVRAQDAPAVALAVDPDVRTLRLVALLTLAVRLAVPVVRRGEPARAARVPRRPVLHAVLEESAPALVARVSDRSVLRAHHQNPASRIFSRIKHHGSSKRSSSVSPQSLQSII